MNWIEKFPANHAPNTKDIEDYLGSVYSKLYNEYLSYLRNEFNLKYVRLKFNKRCGWYQSIGSSGVIMIKKLTFDDLCFFVNDVCIISHNALRSALNEARNLYINEFKDKLAKTLSQRSIRNKDKRKIKLAGLNSSLLSSEINRAKFNKFNWAKSVLQVKIKNLYLSDAKGILDGRLLDEVGFGFYARCYQAKEERALIAHNQMKCHNCRKILTSDTIIYSCSCGYKYTFNEYKRSFTDNKMPNGNAVQTFDLFIIKWESVKEDTDKMQAIDWIIHEIHIGLNGMIGRFVGQQLIDGTGAEIKKLILTLAYGNNSVASIQNLNRFKYYKNEISEKDYRETITNDHIK